MKHTLSALLVLLACSILLVRAKTPDVSGKYYRCTTVRGVAKVSKAEYLDFHPDGRCGYRWLRSDRLGAQRFTTGVVSYEQVGGLIEITTEDGFVTYEIKGDRIVSGNRVYLRASAADSMSGGQKPVSKPAPHLARKK